MGEREGTRQRPPRTRRWAQGLAATVVILAAAGLIQHTLPWANRIPFGAGSNEDSYRQYVKPEWAVAPERGARTATRRPETPPAASAPMRKAAKVAAPQEPRSALESGQATGQGWFGAGNEESLAGEGAYQDGLASRIAPMLADQAEPVPHREAGGRFYRHAPTGKAGLERDWKRQAGEKKAELGPGAPRHSKAPPALAMAPPASIEADAYGRSDYGLEEDTSRLAQQEAAQAAQPGFPETPVHGQRGRGNRSLDSIGQLRSKAKDARRYEERAVDEVFEESPVPGPPTDMPLDAEREAIARNQSYRGALRPARPAAAPEKPVFRHKADEQQAVLAESVEVPKSDSRRQAAKEQPHRPFAVDDALALLSPGIAGDKPPPASIDVDKARQTARQYLVQSAALTGLRFQEATGYWANTYVPGDPAMRLLDTRLSRWDRRGLGGDLRLEKAARQNWQPFDPPRNAALALYLNADRAGIQDHTRMRVQVGLKGTPRQGGFRPVMSLGLVLDLRAMTADDTGASIRALVHALQEARQPGDRFSITVAGRPGALLVPAQAFRHGPIQVAMKTLFGGEPRADEKVLDLTQALTVARSTVQASDDPTATLGTNMILLVTFSSLGAQLPALERFAHQGALQGIPLSVAALGDGANIDEIDRLVRAGQGNRRILRTPDEATDLVQRELSAVSRVVARAVRLRIRFAPHVKLVQVLGSRRLDTVQAQRIRQAEHSIDQRMARNLGIKADRGEDEEGIQIVIPSFFADDTHVVLLDVVAERPGFIADAQVRYKDLVFLRNGVARTRLNLEEGESDPGPLQLRVLKNRLAMELAVSARQAGHWLASGNPQQAVAVLTWVRDLLHGMRYEIAGWSTDPDLQIDVAMVTEYLAMLDSPVMGDATERSLLADSLRYAAHRRLVSVAQ